MSLVVVVIIVVVAVAVAASNGGGGFAPSFAAPPFTTRNRPFLMDTGEFPCDVALALEYKIGVCGIAMGGCGSCCWSCCW